MNKYINVDKLIAKIKARQSELVEHIKTDTSSEKAIDGSKTVELQWVLDIIDSFQQEMWKPNEEQMSAVESAYSVLKSHDTWGEDEHLSTLMSLINDLKKLF